MWRAEIGVLSCNSGLIWPDLERTTVHGNTHTSRVTGHKEPLCQVTEHREKDKGLEGCDMTNMRGFVGLRGDWHYSRGWLTLLIYITHQSRSQQRRADKPHTQPRHMSENPASTDSTQTRIFTQVAPGFRMTPQTNTFDLCTRIIAGRPKHVISWWKCTFMASDVHKYKIPLPAVDKTVIPFPQRAGSKISN